MGMGWIELWCIIISITVIILNVIGEIDSAKIELRDSNGTEHQDFKAPDVDNANVTYFPYSEEHLAVTPISYPKDGYEYARRHRGVRNTPADEDEALVDEILQIYEEELEELKDEFFNKWWKIFVFDMVLIIVVFLAIYGVLMKRRMFILPFIVFFSCALIINIYGLISGVRVLKFLSFCLPQLIFILVAGIFLFVYVGQQESYLASYL